MHPDPAPAGWALHSRAQARGACLGGHKRDRRARARREGEQALFSDEIDAWIIEEFIKIGCDTARSVLDLDEEGLISRTDLEAETVKEVIRILKKELE